MQLNPKKLLLSKWTALEAREQGEAFFGDEGDQSRSAAAQD